MENDCCSRCDERNNSSVAIGISLRGCRTVCRRPAPAAPLPIRRPERRCAFQISFRPCPRFRANGAVLLLESDSMPLPSACPREFQYLVACHRSRWSCPRAEGGTLRPLYHPGRRGHCWPGSTASDPAATCRSCHARDAPVDEREHHCLYEGDSRTARRTRDGDHNHVQRAVRHCPACWNVG